MVNPTSSGESRGGHTPFSDLKPSVFVLLFLSLASFSHAQPSFEAGVTNTVVLTKKVV